MLKKISGIAIVILLIIVILFYPFLNFKSFVKNNTAGQELVLTSYWNPFKPKVSEIIALKEGGYWVTVIDYERVGLFEFKRGTTVNGQQKPIDLSQVDAKIEGKSLDQTKEIAKNQDLSKEPYLAEKSEYDKNQEIEMQKPLKCQAVYQYGDSNIVSNINDIKKISKNQTFLEIKKMIPKKGVGDIGKTFVYNIKIKDDQNPVYIKARLEFENGVSFIDGDNLNAKIIALTLIKNDCSEEIIFN